MKQLKIPYKQILTILTAAMFLSCCIIPCNRLSKKEIRKMEEKLIINSGGRRTLFPIVVGMGQEVENIFAVPEENAVGTIDIRNAISYLKFHGDNIRVDIVKKDFAKEVSGEFDFSFLPLYSDKEISYGQTRWMIFQDLETKENRTEFIINNLDDFLGKIEVMSLNPKTFAVEILKPRGHDGEYKFVNIIEIDKDTFSTVSEIDAGPKRFAYSEPWTASDGKIFVYDHGNRKIKVFNREGKADTHPLQMIFDRNSKKFRRIKEISFHPELPFALIIEEGNPPDLKELRKKRDEGIINWEQYLKLEQPVIEERDRHVLWLARWDTDDTKKQLIPLLSDAGNLIPGLDSVTMYEDFQFSPNGEWLVFRDVTESEYNPVFISVPVSGKKPNFLGDPLFLGKVLREGRSVEARGAAWIKSPTSYVVTDGFVLYKWELENIDKARVINKE